MNKSKEKKETTKEEKGREMTERCCYVVDPCGCYVFDPCGCYYVDPCCW